MIFSCNPTLSFTSIYPVISPPSFGIKVFFLIEGIVQVQDVFISTILIGVDPILENL